MYSRLAVLIVFVSQVLLLGVYYPKWQKSGTEALLSWDVAGYYMYLPAAFIYNDLTGDSYHKEITDTYRPSPTFDHAFKHESGNYVMKYPIGQAIQMSPFFGLSHAYAKTSNTYPADGFSRPYQLGIAFGVLLFALLGMVLLRRLLLKYFPDNVVAWTVIGVGIGTNYLEYTTMSGAMTHNNLFVLYLALILVTIKFYKSPGLWHAVVIGGIIGLATITRPTELMMGLIPLLWGTKFTAYGFKNRFAFLAGQWKALLLAAVVGAAVLFLQPLYWHSATGEWIVYSYQDQGFSFLKPHILDGMFSFKAGWLPYTPLGILMLGGLVLFWRKHKATAPAVCLYLALFMYITWAWDIWWYGGSLGQRSMVQVYPLLAFGLAALIQTAAGKKGIVRILTGLAFGVFVLTSLFWTHQAHKGGMYIASQMTKRFYFAQLGKFDKPNDRRKLLDRAYIFDGEPSNPVTLLEMNFDTLRSDFRCDSLTAFETASMCLKPGIQYGPSLNVPRPSEDATWMRASAKVAVQPREHEVWAMAHLEIRFMKGDKKVAYYNIKPERLSYGEEQEVYFDLPIKEKEYDRIEAWLWRARANTYFSVDDLKVIAW